MVLIFRFLMTSKRRFLVRKREFRGDSLFILDLVLFFSNWHKIRVCNVLKILILQQNKQTVLIFMLHHN